MALPVGCPACGFANEPGEKFCGGCGSPLATASSSPPTADLDAEAERRPVTVLFADLCGYTRLSEGTDPEDVRELLQRYYTDFLVARGRVLVGLASRPDDLALRAEMAGLRAEAERLRWPIGWPGVGTATAAL